LLIKALFYSLPYGHRKEKDLTQLSVELCLDMKTMNSSYIQETKETIVISFTNYLLGICVTLGALAYYKNFTPLNIARVYYLVASFLFLILLAGIVVLVFHKHTSVRGVIQKTYSLISKPWNIVGIIIFSVVLLIFITQIASQRYAFLGTRAFVYGGVLMLYGVFCLLCGGYLIRLSSLIADFAYWASTNISFLNSHVFNGLLLLGAIIYTYRNSFTGALLQLDDLLMIDFARNVSPFAAFISPPEPYTVFYRPMHNIVVWVYYQLFEFDYAKYQAAELLGHIAVVLLLYFLLHIILKDKLIALIGAFIFGTHIYISVGVVYVNAVFWWLGVFGVLVFINVAIGKLLRWRSFLSLVLILLIILLLGEYGFALIGAMWLLSLYILLFDRQNYKYAIALGLLGLIVVIIYFYLRWQAVGIFPQSGGGSSGYFWQFYQNPRPFGASFYIYTISANFISSFVPIFSRFGVLLLPPIMLILVSVIIFSVYMVGLQKISKNSINGYLWLPVLFIYIWGSKEAVSNLIGYYNLSYSFALHTMLNLAIAFLILNWKQISRPHKAISIFALGVILGSSVVAFAYFRWRTHYYSLMGWVILISIGIAYLRKTKSGQAIVLCLLVIALVMSWQSINVLDYGLPVIEIEKYQQDLCDSRVSKDLALDIVNYYNIKSKSILSCISSK